MRNIFPEYNIRLYGKNSESDYFFFLHHNQNIFCSNIGNQNIFFRKKPYPPFKLNGRSLSVGETNNYNLRNHHNISQVTNRLSIFQQSFFPSTTKLWNLLDLRIRQLPTLESFKYKLKQHYFKNANPPFYYNVGNRYLNILQTRIRNNCSTSHNDLFHANLINNPSCSCGYSTKNAEHFFVLYYKRFDAQRNICTVLY